MQVLVPFVSIDACCEALADDQLEEARHEVVKLLEALMADGKQPAARMWRGHEGWLVKVGMEYCMEWMTRGNDCDVIRLLASLLDRDAKPPAWWGDSRVHESHQSYLLRTYPSTYKGKFDVPDDLPVFWAGPENEAFFRNREVVRLRKAAERAADTAAAARARAEEAERLATQDAKAEEAQAAARENHKRSNNGWR